MKRNSPKLKTGIPGILILLFTANLLAQPDGNVKRSYRESWVRYLMADIALGGDIGFYKKFTEDANSMEAIQRIENGEHITNLDQFERKLVPGKNIRIVYKGSTETISGGDVKTESDQQFNEKEIRLALLVIQLGADPEKELNITKKSLTESRRRYAAEVRVLQPDLFKLSSTDDKKLKPICTKTGKDASCMDIKLTSDIGYDEDLVCYMLADIYLGGPVAFYEEIFDSWNDPNAGEAVRRWKNSEKIKNIDQFARVELEGKGTKIVWKGTEKIISGNEVIIE